MTIREILNNASDDAITNAILRGASMKCTYCIYDEYTCPNPYTERYCREGIKKFLQSEATKINIDRINKGR